MSATTNFSPILAPAAPIRGTWRGRLAGWLARLATTRQRTPADTSPAGLGNHLRHATLGCRLARPMTTASGAWAG